MAAKENRALTKRVFDALSKGDLTAAEKVLGPELRKGAAVSARAAKQALPDVKVHLEDMVAEGDKVVARWTATGTHKGAHQDPFFGSVKGTGKSLNVTGITILRFEDGHVVETWGLTDELGAVKQLGLVKRRG
jgi:predicted ester cyclase